MGSTAGEPARGRPSRQSILHSVPQYSECQPGAKPDTASPEVCKDEKNRSLLSGRLPSRGVKAYTPWSSNSTDVHAVRQAATRIQFHGASLSNCFLFCIKGVIVSISQGCVNTEGANKNPNAMTSLINVHLFPSFHKLL